MYLQGAPTSFRWEVLVKISNLREIRNLNFLFQKKIVKLKWMFKLECKQTLSRVFSLFATFSDFLLKSCLKLVGTPGMCRNVITWLRWTFMCLVTWTRDSLKENNLRWKNGWIPDMISTLCEVRQDGSIYDRYLLDLFLYSFRPSTSRSQDTWQRLGFKTRARGNANELAKSLEFRLHG